MNHLQIDSFHSRPYVNVKVSVNYVKPATYTTLFEPGREINVISRAYASSKSGHVQPQFGQNIDESWQIRGTVIDMYNQLNVRRAYPYVVA